MVTRRRLERLTLWLKVRCSTNWASGSYLMAGVAGFEPAQWQSQSLLPYRLAIPHSLDRWWRGVDSNHRTKRNWVTVSRVYPLRYLSIMVPAKGLEPSTYWLQVSCSTSWAKPAYLFLWWRLTGSNRWPSACKADALPTELNLHNATLLVYHYFK